MERFIAYFSEEWARSGNPVWLKAAMLVAVVVLAVLLVRAVVLFLRECQRLEREEDSKWKSKH